MSERSDVPKTHVFGHGSSEDRMSEPCLRHC
jgi:hypothetical protein